MGDMEMSAFGTWIGTSYFPKLEFVGNGLCKPINPASEESVLGLNDVIRSTQQLLSFQVGFKVDGSKNKYHRKTNYKPKYTL